MTVTSWKIIGYSAAILTTSGFLPQIAKMLRTRSAKDISVIMLMQYLVGVFFWFLYGVHIHDGIIIVANGLTTIFFIIGLFLYAKYR